MSHKAEKGRENSHIAEKNGKGDFAMVLYFMFEPFLDAFKIK